MGKTTGFMDYSRELAPRRPVARARERLVRNLSGFPRRKASQAGRALHGLWRPFLSDRMSGKQSHPRLERSGLSRTLERSCPPVACDE